MDGTLALRCAPRRLVHSLTTHTSSRAPGYAAGGMWQFTGKTRAGSNSRSGGRSRSSELGMRALDTTARGVCTRRDDPGGEGYPRGPCWGTMSRRDGANAGFSCCETGYGVSFARPDCTRIEEGIAWARPDWIRTESIRLSIQSRISLNCPASFGIRVYSHSQCVPVQLSPRFVLRSLTVYNSRNVSALVKFDSAQRKMEIGSG